MSYIPEVKPVVKVPRESNQNKVGNKYDQTRKYSSDFNMVANEKREISPEKKGFPKNEHRPSFLNTLKKNKESKDMIQEFAKSTVGKFGKNGTQESGQSDIDNKKAFQKTSAILTSYTPPSAFQSPKSINRDEGSKSAKVIKGDLKPFGQSNSSNDRNTKRVNCRMFCFIRSGDI